MSANFSLSGNSQFDNDSLKSSCHVVAVLSELNFSISGGVFPEGVAFLRFIVLISFSISDTLIASKLKDFPFPILPLMSNILGWISYILIVLSTGSKAVLDSLLTIYEFHLYLKLIQHFLKRCLVFLQLCHHFVLNRHFR